MYLVNFQLTYKDMLKPVSKIPFWRMVTPQIRFRHLRDSVDTPAGDKNTNSFGGMTIAYQWFSDLEELHIAHALCNDIDRYTKETGRRIASGRLLSRTTHRIYAGISRTKIKHQLEYDAASMLVIWANRRHLDLETTERVNLS